MSQEVKTYQQSIAFGWLAMAMVMMMTSVAALVQAAIQTDFSEYAYHPGPEGLTIMCLLIPLYVFVAVATQRFDSSWIRWLNLLLLPIVTVFALLHQISHFHHGFVHSMAAQVLDMTHHLIGIWMSILAYFWVRAHKRN